MLRKAVDIGMLAPSRLSPPPGSAHRAKTTRTFGESSSRT
jgi:hypothetical protein